MYGATAELGVIHILTRKPESIQGAVIATDTGVSGGENSRREVELLAGKETETWRWSLSAYHGRALRSTSTYTLPSGSYAMGQEDYVHPEYVNLSLGVGEFGLRYLRDYSAVDARAAGGVVRPAAWQIEQNQQALLLTYPFISSSLSVTPSLLYQEQSPRETTTHTGELNSKTSLRRTLAKVDLHWSLADAWSLSGGGEYLDIDYRGEVRPFPLRPLAYEHMNNSAYYGELLYQAGWGNLVLSGRLEHHDYAGDLWAERLAYTKLWERWNFKWISSRAERAPSLEDYSAGVSGLAVRDNETVRSHELELGWRGDSHQQITFNLFDITTYDTLILTNQGTTGTRGLELVYQHPLDWGEVSVAYAHYRVQGTSTEVALPRRFPEGELLDDSAHVAYAPNKLSASMSYRFSADVSLNPSVMWLSRRWVYSLPTVAPAIGTLQELESVTLFDLALDCRNLGIKGLDLNVAVHNLLNQGYDFYLPYRSGGSYLPDMGREWVLGLRYRF
jgi:outer membrane receptor protein involved in Fe transport